VAIVDGVFEQETGYRICWRRCASGVAAITAPRSGEADIVMAGSSPIAAAVSEGAKLEVVWIAEDIAAAKALVLRDGTGIVAPRDLIGHTVAALTDPRHTFTCSSLSSSSAPTPSN
jgi:taurine transport system substrate-binding protein